MINIGVIGVGYLGQHHARIYSELSMQSNDIRLAAVVDSDRQRAEQIANKYGCKAYSDYTEILNRIDALSIASPTTTHYRIAMDAITAGKDVLIEKPITVTVEEADCLITASEKAGTIIQTGHLERFNPAVSLAQSLITKPIFIEAERLSPFLGRGTDVDITLDLMIHDIDIILAILGAESIRDIKATGANIMTDKIDIAKAWLDFDSGIQALATASRVSVEKSRKLTIFQNDSYLVVDYQNMEIKRFFKNGSEMLNETINVEKKEPLKEELKDFIDCVKTRRRPLVSAIEGRNALKIAIQIGEKIRNEAND
jgi:predicted dehydrogenase